MFRNPCETLSRSDFLDGVACTQVQETLQVLKAADAAARWHVHHRRKGSAKEPYVNHLLEVALLVADATGSKDTNLVIAALLHDAIEDCEEAFRPKSEGRERDNVA
jgi:GTP diphosphokinase / guanosine-3',5'-bis(diphosphate) 3'-diphosphatase